MTPDDRKALAARISTEIDTYCATAYNDGHRNHLGASIIGKECDFQLWATFRWLASPNFSGRMQRLFNRGHREEERFTEWLRGIGFTIWDVDPATGKQFRVSGVDGHFGGSLDGVGVGPDWFKEIYPGAIVVEYKTKGTGSGFNKLCAQGVKIVHPEHFGQNSIYGKKLELKYVLYLSINKNDDTIHVEIEELDWAESDRKEARARDIIYATAPPKRVSSSPTYYLCKGCFAADQCHHGAKPEVNCRSCRNATPAPNGEWHCNRFASIIPREAIPNACPEWESVV